MRLLRLIFANEMLNERSARRWVGLMEWCLVRCNTYLLAFVRGCRPAGSYTDRGREAFTVRVAMGFAISKLMVIALEKLSSSASSKAWSLCGTPKYWPCAALCMWFVIVV